MVEEAQKYKAKRIVEILVEKGILDNHFKANVQTEEAWEQALAEAIAQAEGEVWEELNRDGRHDG